MTTQLADAKSANMSELRQICVFCGAGTGHDPAHEKAATKLGHDLAKADIRLIYGGGSIGLMGAMARSALHHGGKVTGIIPHFLKQAEEMLSDLTELIVTEDLHERKRLMFERSDAIVALPGGIGTLEEVVEQMTWAQLGRHNKPVVLANINGFWQPLIDLLSHMREEQFIRPGFEVSWLTAQNVSEIVPLVRQEVASRADKPQDREMVRHVLKPL